MQPARESCKSKNLQRISQGVRLRPHNLPRQHDAGLRQSTNLHKLCRLPGWHAGGLTLYDAHHHPAARASHRPRRPIARSADSPTGQDLALAAAILSSVPKRDCGCIAHPATRFSRLRSARRTTAQAPKSSAPSASSPRCLQASLWGDKRLPSFATTIDSTSPVRSRCSRQPYFATHRPPSLSIRTTCRRRRCASARAPTSSRSMRATCWRERRQPSWPGGISTWWLLAWRQKAWTWGSLKIQARWRACGTRRCSTSTRSRAASTATFGN